MSRYWYAIYMFFTDIRLGTKSRPAKIRPARLSMCILFYNNRGIILEHQSQESKDQKNPDNIPFWRVVLSVLQASFGVQTSSNRERDFSKGSFWPFVVAAFIFTIVFILTIAGIVSLVLPD